MPRTESIAPKARNSVYTGMLAISLLVLIGAATILYLDYAELTAKKPERVNINVPGLTPGKSSSKGL